MGHKEFNMEEYWAWRARAFSQIEWVSNAMLRTSIADKLKDCNVNVVVDLGCGVGIQSRFLAHLGYGVIGVDNSAEMIRLARQEQMDAVEYRIEDVRQTGMANACVDAAVLCMVLHNVFPDWTAVLAESARIVRNGGTLIVAEGMPPSPECSQFFESMLSNVHPRHFFSRETLIEQIERSNFRVQAREEVTLKGMSVKNWLQRSVWDQDEISRLYIRHQNMPRRCRRHYNYTSIDDDVLIDICFVIVAAKLFKPNV